MPRKTIGTSERSTVATVVAAAFAAAVLAGTAIPATAADCGGVTPCSCGDTVTADRTLSAADPVTTVACAGDGLVVAPGVTLNLGSQTITGAPGGIGVVLGAGSKLLGPGTGCGRGASPDRPEPTLATDLAPGEYTAGLTVAGPTGTDTESRRVTVRP